MTYNDPMETITHLKQPSTLTAYKVQFEAISNHLIGLSEDHKLSCFLNWVKDEIHIPIRMLNLLNLNATFGLVKI